MGKVIPASEMALRRVKKRLAPPTTSKFAIDQNDIPGTLIKARAKLLELEQILHSSPDVRAREQAVIDGMEIRFQIHDLLTK